MAWQVGAAVGGGGTSFALRCPTRWRLTPSPHDALRWPCAPAHRPRADRSARRAPPRHCLRRALGAGTGLTRSPTGSVRQASRRGLCATCRRRLTRDTARDPAPGVEPGVVHPACLRSQLAGIAPCAHVDAHHNGSAKHWLLRCRRWRRRYIFRAAVPDLVAPGAGASRPATWHQESSAVALQPGTAGTLPLKFGRNPHGCWLSGPLRGMTLNGNSNGNRSGTAGTGSGEERENSFLLPSSPSGTSLAAQGWATELAAGLADADRTTRRPCHPRPRQNSRVLSGGLNRAVHDPELRPLLSAARGVWATRDPDPAAGRATWRWRRPGATPGS
jgi:hypothetical protein